MIMPKSRKSACTPRDSGMKKLLNSKKYGQKIKKGMEAAIYIK